MPGGLARFRIGSGPVQQRHALVSAWAGSRCPTADRRRAAARAGLQHDEAGQVVRLAADAVGEPGAHAGPAEAAGAGVDEQLGRAVVEDVGRHALDDAHVVDDRGQVRQQLAELGAALAVAGELARGAQQLGVPLDEGEPLVLDERGGDRPGRRAPAASACSRTAPAGWARRP